MADETGIILGWYDNSLTVDEARKLIALDQQIVHVLYMNNMHARPEWIGTTEDGERFVQCVIADPQPRVLLALPSREFDALSAETLLSRLEESLRRP